MSKWCTSPIGETVSDDSLGCGVEYMTEEEAQHRYVMYNFLMVYYGEPEKAFAKWLEAQGVKLV